MAFKDFGKRVGVAVVAGPAVVLAAWFGKIYFLTLVVVIIAVSLYEFLKILESKGSPPAAFWSYLFIVAIPILAYLNFSSLLLPAMVLYVSGVLVIELFRRPGSAIVSAGGALLAYGYVGVLFTFMLAVRELPRELGMPYRAGGEWILLVLLSIWVCDTAAYLVGSRLGRHKLAPAISPNKSIEGAIGGIAGGLLCAWACTLLFVQSLTTGQALVVGAVAGVFGQLSDLVESMFKRDAGVKDTSRILPGHGGVLDRFDSEMLVAPIIYFYLRFVVFAG